MIRFRIEIDNEYQGIGISKKPHYSSLKQVLKTSHCINNKDREDTKSQGKQFVFQIVPR